MPKLLATFLVSMLALALGAAPALAHGNGHGKDRHAKHAKPNYVYTATIDCGRGPITVVSEEDLFAPLVDQQRHRVYMPIAWDVKVGDFAIQEEKPGVPEGLKRHATDCSYSDGVATGTVTVLGAWGRSSSR